MQVASPVDSNGRLDLAIPTICDNAAASHAHWLTHHQNRRGLANETAYMCARQSCFATDQEGLERRSLLLDSSFFSWAASLAGRGRDAA